MHNLLYEIFKPTYSALKSAWISQIQKEYQLLSLFVHPTLRHNHLSSFTDQPGEIILQDTHEDDDDEAQEQDHQHQRVDNGQPVDLQCFGEERVVSEALGSPGVRERGLEPAHAVGVGDRKAASAYPDPTHSCTRSLFQGEGLDVFYGDVSEDHRVTVVLDVEVQVSPQPHLLQVREDGKKKKKKRGSLANE